MKNLYNICLTIIIVVMTICITCAAIHFGSLISLFFLVLPTLISEFLTYDKEGKK